MKKIKILIVVLFLLVVTGCYNYRELNELSIVSAIGIDKDKNDNIKVTIQVINSKKESSDSSQSNTNATFITYESSAKTIQEALRKVVLSSPKRFFATQMQILVISEKCAKDDITKYIDFFTRDPEIQMKFLTLIAKDTTANKILTTLTPLETINSTNIRESLKTNTRYLGIGYEITFEDVINNMINDKIEISMPSVIIINENKNQDSTKNLEKVKKIADSKISSIAVFKNNKLIGYLTDQESIAYSFILDNIENTIITTKCASGHISSEIIESHTKIDTNKNNISINISANANINESTCETDLNSKKDLNKIKRSIENNIKNNINNTLNTVQKKYKSDIFGFEDLIYKNDPKYYNNIKNWDNFYQNINFKVNVNIDTLEKGNTLYTPERKLKNEK